MDPKQLGLALHVQRDAALADRKDVDKRGHALLDVPELRVGQQRKTGIRALQPDIDEAIGLS